MITILSKFFDVSLFKTGVIPVTRVKIIYGLTSQVVSRPFTEISIENQAQWGATKLTQGPYDQLRPVDLLAYKRLKPN